MKRAIYIIGICLLVSCSKSSDLVQSNDFFFLINKEAKMPVSVRGNRSSGILILFVHGGPGGSALQKIGLPAFNDLEQSYGTVFWDQRASGTSQGNSPNSLMTLPQFVEDLDKLVDLLRYRYGNPKIFLMGHSWGGCLGTAYLSDVTRQSKIKGWIEVDGAHNNPKGDSLSLNWITSYAQGQITQQTDTDFWNYVLSWYSRNPNFTSNQLEHYAFLEKANGYIHDPSIKREPASFPGYSSDYIFHSPADISMTLTNYDNVIRNFVISDIDLTPQMSGLTLPSLIVWGKFDGVIPFPMATHALNSLGTSPSKKSIWVLPNSGHDGFYEEPQLFATGVRQFIETYK